MKDSARVIILLRLTTDGHKASRGLSANLHAIGLSNQSFTYKILCHCFRQLILKTFMEV